MAKKLSGETLEMLKENGVYPQANYIKPVSHEVIIGLAAEKEKLERENEKLERELVAEDQYALEMPIEHLDFCDHFVNGDLGVYGDARQAYVRAFGKKVSKREAAAFLRRRHIAAKIQEMYEEKQKMHIGKRMYIEGKLLSIAEECSKAKFKDRFGNYVSPAAMRSVAVNAYSKVADMNGFNQPIEVKDVSENKTGVHFNLIVPTKSE